VVAGKGTSDVPASLSKLGLELRQQTSDGEVIVAARANGVTIGLALVDLSLCERAKLRSIVVDPGFRGCGVAQGLLAFVEEHLRGRGTRHIEAVYETGLAPDTVLSHILKKAGWMRASAATQILHISGRIVQAPWMRTPLPAGCEVFAWSQLTALEAADLAAQPWYPQPLGPFPDEAPDPLCSVGIRHDGQVVGWMLTHRVRPGLMRYSRLFVRPGHRARVCGVVLIAAAIRRQPRVEIEGGMFCVSAANLPMLRIVARRIAPYIERKTELICASKDLVHRPEAVTGRLRSPTNSQQTSTAAQDIE